MYFHYKTHVLSYVLFYYLSLYDLYLVRVLEKNCLITTHFIDRYINRPKSRWKILYTIFEIFMIYGFLPLHVNVGVLITLFFSIFFHPRNIEKYFSTDFRNHLNKQNGIRGRLCFMFKRI